MSLYRSSADITGSSHTGQLHGLDALTLDPLTDTYIWVKAVREWSGLIDRDEDLSRNRAHAGQLFTMARKLYRSLAQLQQQVLDNAQAQGQVKYKLDDQVVEQVIGLVGKEPPMPLVTDQNATCL
jgi:hypothetical protein